MSGGSTLYVGNLPFWVQEEQLRQRFEEAGTVKSVNMPKDEEMKQNKGFAFVEYEDRPIAEAALRALQGVEMSGRTLRVEFAATATHRGANRTERRSDRGGRAPAGAGGHRAGAQERGARPQHPPKLAQPPRPAAALRQPAPLLAAPIQVMHPGAPLMQPVPLQPQQAVLHVLPAAQQQQPFVQLGASQQQLAQQGLQPAPHAVLQPVPWPHLAAPPSPPPAAAPAMPAPASLPVAAAPAQPRQPVTVAAGPPLEPPASVGSSAQRPGSAAGPQAAPLQSHEEAHRAMQQFSIFAAANPDTAKALLTGNVGLTKQLFYEQVQLGMVTNPLEQMGKGADEQRSAAAQLAAAVQNGQIQQQFAAIPGLLRSAADPLPPAAATGSLAANLQHVLQAAKPAAAVPAAPPLQQPSPQMALAYAAPVLAAGPQHPATEMPPGL